MRKSIGVAVVLAMGALSLSGAPAMARRERPQPNVACDPAMQAAARLTTPVGLLIGGYDSNGDALVDRRELKAGTDRMFGIADQNRDGFLSLIELSEWAAIWLGGPSAIPGRFDFDRDQDDRISASEFAAELERRFMAFDSDRNGIVDRGELLSADRSRNCAVEPAPQPVSDKAGSR